MKTREQWSTRACFSFCNSYSLYTQKEHKNSEIFELLVRSGADVNGADKDGLTPLMSCQDSESIRLLLAHGARVETRDKKGDTALSIVKRQHNNEAVRLLQQAGAKE